ncbi:MAG: DUF368 domain-containing protein [Dehalococcoidia bacterium]
MPDTDQRPSSTPSRLRRTARHYLFGALMGSADIVPGVSGGTVALILGIYARLIDSVGHGAAAIGRGGRFDLAAARAHLRAVDWGLVLPLLAGILSAVVLGSAIIPDLIDEYPVQMRSLFFGLIAASIVIPWRRIDERGPGTFVALLLAAAVAFLFTGLPDSVIETPALWQVFGAASVAICAMILPGVSGAFLLVVLGMYEATLDAVHDRDVVYLIVFVAGAVTGLALFSTVLRWLLEQRHDLTMAILVGLMAGSLRALWPFQADDRSLSAPSEGDPLLVAAALAVVGFVVILVLARLGDGAEHRDPA